MAKHAGDAQAVSLVHEGASKPAAGLARDLHRDLRHIRSALYRGLVHALPLAGPSEISLIDGRQEDPDVAERVPEHRLVGAVEHVAERAIPDPTPMGLNY
jgi:hypothetical protein